MVEIVLKCPKCGFIPKTEEEVKSIEMSTEHPPICPKCGAFMYHTVIDKKKKLW